jgi:hypothetical protein
MQFLIDIGLSILYFCIFLLLCAWTWRFWMMYIQAKSLASLKWVMLEIKLPREILKSPLATEVAIATLLQGGGVSNKIARNFNGGLPIFSSLEIASIEGVIHFYIRIQSKLRSLVEANFYAQYPGIEIIEAEDYTKRIEYHHLSKDVGVWGATYRTSKSWEPVDFTTGKKFEHHGKPISMKADFLPIKTYVDYGLDKDPKEEFKIDPLTPLLEVMSSIGKGEHFWYQVLVQDESVYDSKKFPKFYVNEATHEHISLKDMADHYKKQTRTSGYITNGQDAYDDYGDLKTKQVKVGTGDDGKPIFETVTQKYTLKETKALSKKDMDLTMEEKESLESINKKLSKPLALTVTRLMYVAEKKNFNYGHIQNILSFPKPYKGVNSFGFNVTAPYDYDWQDIGKKRSSWRGEEMFEEYVEREGFFPHIPKRKSLDSWEDMFFWSASMKQRKMFRMMYEAIFYPFDHPHADDACVLNLEEVATLWHLPGAVATSPGLPRIDSKKGIAPANLPV